MYDSSDRLIYVGKAKSLKKRVLSYFTQQKTATAKTSAMMSQCHKIEFTITQTENEALLLEANLIKQHRPRYNVLLRDDKSYPYLYLTTTDDYPRLDLFRGNVDTHGCYYGPFSGATVVRNNLHVLQKVFKLRQCSNGFFRSRKTPCLQYQIDCCTAPCVDKVSQKDYAKQVHALRSFLDGRDDSLVAELQDKMQACSKSMEFEDAAMYRDRIAQLRAVTGAQSMVSGRLSADVFAVHKDAVSCCVVVLFVRHGRVLGHKSYFPRVSADTSLGCVISDFLSQYYLQENHRLAHLDKIVSSEPIENKDWLQDALIDLLGQKIKLVDKLTSHYRNWCAVAKKNAEEQLRQKASRSEIDLSLLFESLVAELKLPKPVYHMECFDISHTFGAATVASCVVFDVTAVRKDLYRKFNIKGVTPGDDYAAMEQVLRRRYQRLKKQGEPLPDCIVVDGGVGQMTQAVAVLSSLEMGDITLIGVAKGRSRKPGKESIWVHGQTTPYALSLSSKAMRLIQMIRDEAHRFAIAGHRQKRRQLTLHSELESLPGIGVVQRQAILKHFGGRQGLFKASLDDLLGIPGVGRVKARLLFEFIKKKQRDS